MKILFDTSVLVAAMVESHPEHERALLWLRKAQTGAVGFHVAAHTLAEVYAVLTRLPVNPRISPGLALRLVQENIVSHATVTTLTAAEYLATIRRLAAIGVAGGAVYDGLLARAAEKSGVDRLLTLDAADFQRVWPEGSSRIHAP